jgi:hypothetical protein
MALLHVAFAEPHAGNDQAHGFGIGVGARNEKGEAAQNGETQKQ